MFWLLQSKAVLGVAISIASSVTQKKKEELFSTAALELDGGYSASKRAHLATLR
jgi:hypothetical protein